MPQIPFSPVTFSFCSPSFPPLGEPSLLCRVLILLGIGSLLATAKSSIGEPGAQPYSPLGVKARWSRSVPRVGEVGTEGQRGGRVAREWKRSGGELGGESLPSSIIGWVHPLLHLMHRCGSQMLEGSRLWVPGAPWSLTLRSGESALPSLSSIFGYDMPASV